MVGLSEAGKTALFTQLSNQSYVDTVTSMKENEEQISVRGGRKLITLVDVPGFDRLRNQSWERFKDRSLGIIFVIDSVTFLSNLHNVADLLYQYLSDDSITAKRIPFLIACTKQDETRAKTAKVIATQLEKELYVNVLHSSNFPTNFFIIFIVIPLEKHELELWIPFRKMIILDVFLETKIENFNLAIFEIISSLLIVTHLKNRLTMTLF